jgi:hypothetical protein
VCTAKTASGGSRLVDWQRCRASAACSPHGCWGFRPKVRQWAVGFPVGANAAAPSASAASPAASTPSGNNTDVQQGKGRAPQQGRPNSIYEQVDDKGNVRSRTFYDENGRSFSRQDFDHSHGGMQPHEHQRQFDASGRPVTKETVIQPDGYNNSPN